MLLKRFALLLLVLGLLLSGCQSEPQTKTYTIAVMVELPWLEGIYHYFKEAMTEMGYVEGVNVTYIYEPTFGPDQAAFNQEAERLMAYDPDLFFTVGTMTTRAAKEAVTGTDIPVVFTPVINVMNEGLVDSLSRPGGNVTGVQIIDQSPKGLEWAIRIVPDAQNVYIPHNPADPITAGIMEGLLEAIPALGVNLLPSEVATVEEMVSRVATLPEHTIIYVVSPISSLEGGVEQLGQAALQYRVPLITCNRDINEPPFSIANYSVSTREEARQGARMVDRILRGANPADTPVETAEYFLTIHLGHAEQIGLQIPDSVLNQANEIIR